MSQLALCALAAASHIAIAADGAEQPSTGTVYKCVGPRGLIQYTNTKCIDGSIGTVVTKYSTKGPPPAETSPSPEPESDLTSHKHYTNINGDVVHSLSATVSGNVPAGASAQCGDGTYSFSRNHRGTCLHHGGVARWL